jgi:uncharacterized membrane protein
VVVLLELTVVLFGWTFSPAFNFFVLQVIWAIGWSMIALAGLIYLPRGALAALALAMIGGHNLLDAIRAEQLQGFASLWLLLHEPGFLQPVPGIKVLAVYPLVPWIGVMAAGYACGPVLNFPEPQRRRWLLGSGLSLESDCLRVDQATEIGRLSHLWSSLLSFPLWKVRLVPAGGLFPGQPRRCRAG